LHIIWQKQRPDHAAFYFSVFTFHLIFTKYRRFNQKEAAFLDSLFYTLNCGYEKWEELGPTLFSDKIGEPGDFHPIALEGHDRQVDHVNGSYCQEATKGYSSQNIQDHCKSQGKYSIVFQEGTVLFVFHEKYRDRERPKKPA
jgi:hypothetical protein